MADRWDTVIVGGGILGLAVAREMLTRRPDQRLLLLEKERALAQHQTGRNSGVVHAGLYYQPGSAKARFCLAGKRLLQDYCADRGIPCPEVGKMVVALTRDELPGLAEIERRARLNGVPDLEVLDPDGMRRWEPNVVGIRALRSPHTAVVDFRRVAASFAEDVTALGGEIRTGVAVTELNEGGAEVVIRTGAGDFVAATAIACAGLWADRLARTSGDTFRERIVPFRGDYFRLRPEAQDLVRGLIYPIPDPRFPFLGIHLTRRSDGEVWAGPNAVLALARSGYRRADVNMRDLAETLAFAGFRRLAFRFWKVGLKEQWRDLSKRSFASEVRKYVPAIRDEDLVPGPSGVRAQALDPDGSLVDDFRIGGTRRIVHVRNAPSPAATASMALASEIVDVALAR